MEFWFSEFHTPDVKHSIRVNKQLYSKQSDYQRIDIFETPEFGRVLTLDVGAGAGGDVLQIVILLGDLVIVVLQSASDELRCVGACRLGRIVLVFKHPTAEREVPQDLFHHLFLL